MFSKACEYGIKATLYVAYQSLLGNRVGLKDIAKSIDSPEAFTAKILQQLAKSGIINSLKGPTGGFNIEKDDLAKIRLSHIVEAIDGNSIYIACGLGLKACNELKPCPVHNQFKAIRDELKTMLETTTVQELAIRLNEGGTFLKR